MNKCRVYSVDSWKLEKVSSSFMHKSKEFLCQRDAFIEKDFVARFYSPEVAD